VVFGALNLETGRRLFLARKRQRAEDFQAFLPVVRRHYRGRGVALLLDEDTSHTAQGSRQAAADLGIELIWLPKRCPELNGMDHLWGHGKDHLCANWQYPGIDEEADRFIHYLQSLSDREALRQAGILSEDFWLR
jgi:transposase